MDNLHSVIRSIKGETRPARRDHLTVFRDFINQLDRIGKRQGKAAGKGRAGRRGGSSGCCPQSAPKRTLVIGECAPFLPIAAFVMRITAGHCPLSATWFEPVRYLSLSFGIGHEASRLHCGT